MTRPTSIPADLWDDIPPTLRPAIAAVVAGLEARIAELEARLAQNSSNSHRPPSTDGPHVKPAPPRKPSGKRRGGQAGHPKHERVLLPADETHDRKPTRCRRCCETLAGDDPSPMVDQVVDLPEKLRHVTHYRRHRLQCPHCRAITAATPVVEARTGFGPRITILQYTQGKDANVDGIGWPEGRKRLGRLRPPGPGPTTDLLGPPAPRLPGDGRPEERGQ